MLVETLAYNFLSVRAISQDGLCYFFDHGFCGTHMEQVSQSCFCWICRKRLICGRFLGEDHSGRDLSHGKVMWAGFGIAD